MKLRLKLSILLLSIITPLVSLSDTSLLTDYEAQQVRNRFPFPKVKTATMTRRRGVKKTGSFQILHREYTGTLVSENPITGKDYKSNFLFFKSKKPGKRPLIVIIPTISGTTALEPFIAQYLARRGFHVVISVIPEDISNPKRPISESDNFLIRTTTAVRAHISYFANKYYVDENRIGAFGASLGGIRSLLLMSVDNRVKASKVFVAGGDIPQIMSTSQQRIVKGYRKARMKAEGHETVEEFYMAYKRLSTVDPIDLARFIDRDKVSVVIDLEDTSVPTSNQIDMYKELDEPDLVKYFKRGHFKTAASSMMMKRKIKRFFKKKLR